MERIRYATGNLPGSWLKECETVVPRIARKARGHRGSARLSAVRPRPARVLGLGAIPGLVAMLVLMGGAAYLAARLDPVPAPHEGIARASDGDSLRLQGVRIRLQGVDAPELDQVCWDEAGAEWPCGRLSRARLSEILVEGPAVCRPRGHDKYGRVLATCKSEGRDVGAILVSEGWAIAMGDYAAEQATASAAKLGIWRGRFVDPRQWRDDGPVSAPELSPFDLVWDWFRELTGATTLR